MKKILLVGYFGFDNFGDEWLLKVFVKKIFELTVQPRQIFVLHNIDKLTVKERNIVYLPRWNFYYILQSLFFVDTVVFCGGVFQDETSVLSLVYYFTLLFLAKMLAKKVVLLSTDFVIKKLPRIVQNIIIILSDTVFVRNSFDIQNTKYYFKTKSKNISFCPDICLLDGDTKVIFSKIRQLKTIGLVLKFNMDAKLTLQMCKYLSKCYKLVFIPFHLKQDYKFCLKIINNLNNCEVRVWDDVKNYKNIFSDIDLIISSRLHGIIIAMLLQIPFVCISNEEKLNRLLQSYFAVKPVTLEQLAERNYDITHFTVYPESKKLIEYQQNILLNLKFLVDKSLL